LTIDGAALLDTLGRRIDARHDGQPGRLYKASLTRAGAIAVSGIRSGNMSPLAVQAVDALVKSGSRPKAGHMN
jgi:hypothetical protein